jgi:FkbM family methyltransferase
VKTRTKIRIARGLKTIVVGARGLAGRGPLVRARRGGIAWDLDLNEGIELAIYLGVYQRLPKRVRQQWVKPGANVIDIGANVGAFSLPLLRQVGPAGVVISVEPTDYAFRRLTANASLNPDLASRLIAVQAGLDDGTVSTAAKEYFSRWPLDERLDGRHQRHLGQPEGAAAARSMTLDSLVQELRSSGRLSAAPAFVKLDVDGHELAVLRGGRTVLSQARPALLIEIAPHVQDEVHGRFEELITTISDYGYMLERPESGVALPIDAAKLRSIIGDSASMDVLAVAR